MHGHPRTGSCAVNFLSSIPAVPDPVTYDDKLNLLGRIVAVVRNM